MKNIFIKNKYKKYILLQRNEYMSRFQKKLRKFFGRYLFTNFFVYFFNPISLISTKLNNDFDLEFKKILPFLPKKSNNILDIGSGLGIVDIYIDSFYRNNPNFTLIDKTRVEKKVSYGFDAKGQFYNNFQLTLDFLNNNGLDSKRVNLIDADLKGTINNDFDLVISLLSMGYHYPINQYLDMLKKNTNKNTIFIFDIADEYMGLDTVSSLFDIVKIIHKSKELRHNYLRICCSGIKKL